MENPEQEMTSLLESSGVRFTGYHFQDQIIGPEKVVEILAPHLEENRKDRIEVVLGERTYAIAPVVEGLTNTGNVSAVMRTAEGLGFQSFHIVTGDLTLKYSKRTTQGAQKWLDVSVWKSPAQCVASLRHDGYQIVVTHLSEEARPLAEIDFTKKTALVFGNERAGISQAMLAEADFTCVIPSPGFVQSYNISVAAAMALHAAYSARIEAFGAAGDLSDSELMRLRADFYSRSVKHADDIMKRHLGVI
jgi:tRNA (guanosine-2'-O-)-methyltransferase